MFSSNPHLLIAQTNHTTVIHILQLISGHSALYNFCINKFPNL